MAQRAFSIGDRVHVPWGLDVIDGVVVGVYGEGDHRQVVVKVRLPDAQDKTEDAEDTTVTLPAHVLEEAEAEAEERSPGSWLPALRWERSLRDALTEILRRRWGDRASVVEQERPDFEVVLPDRAIVWETKNWTSGFAPEERPYIEVRFPERTILVEAKAPRSGIVPEDAVTALLAMLAAAQVASGLLVTNGELSEAAEDHLHSAEREGVSLRAVRWRNSRDNQRLARALNELLAA
jgi:hypothetical protein